MLMAAQLEGEPLEKELYEELCAHIEACPSCMLADKRYRRLKKGYELLAAEDPPEEFSRAWREGVIASGKRRLPLRALTMAASFVLLLGIGALAWRAFDRPSGPVPEANAPETRRAAEKAVQETYAGGAPYAAAGQTADIVPFAAAPAASFAPIQNEAAVEESAEAVPDAPEAQATPPPEAATRAQATQPPEAAPEANTGAPAAEQPVTDEIAPEANAAAPSAMAQPIEGFVGASADAQAPEAADEIAEIHPDSLQTPGTANIPLPSAAPGKANIPIPSAAPGTANIPIPSAAPGVLRTNSYTISLSSEDCDAVVAYLSELGKSEASFERALRTGIDAASASVSLNVTAAEQAAFLSYLKDNAFGDTQGAMTLRVKLSVRE